MRIDLSPTRMDATLTVHVDGDTLTLNGIPLDLSSLPEGALLPREAVASDWLASDVTRQDGEICLTLVLPHGPIPWPAPIAATAVLFPAPLHITQAGEVLLPAYRAEELA